MFYKQRDQFNRLKFGLACRGVRSTAPVKPDPDSPIALMTQLQHKDVLLALVAFKSFVARVPVGAFFVLDDGSLTADDQTLLQRHLEGVRFLGMQDAHSVACPTGGCWERLLSIARLVQDYYVIQLDSDTLTIGDIPEIGACVSDNASFVIGTWDKQDFETMAFRQERAQRIVDDSTTRPHIQVAAESNFNKLADFETLRYVRGCAGFSGFGRGSFERGFVEELSGQMLAALGDRWREWGSEQVMSNIVVANTPGSRVLPHPKYCDCTRIKNGETAFIHFIGSCRFTGGVYARLARGALSRLAV
jgi:hypothetical protein